MALAAQALVGTSFAVLGVIDAYPLALGQAPRYLAAVGLMMLVARRRLPRIGRRDLARVALIALSGLVAFNLCVQEGVARSDAASVGVVVGCVPIVLALLGPLQRGERPRAALLAAGAVVAAGAAFVQGGGARFTLTGVALALGAMACEAAFTLLAVPLLPRLGPLGVSGWTCLAGAAMFGAWALADGRHHAPDAGEVAALGWLTVGVTVTAFLLWYRSVGRIGAERAGLFVGVVPVSALATGWLIGRETPSPVQVAGVALVAAGVTWGMRAAARPPRVVPAA